MDHAGHSICSLTNLALPLIAGPYQANPSYATHHPASPPMHHPARYILASHHNAVPSSALPIPPMPCRASHCIAWPGRPSPSRPRAAHATPHKPSCPVKILASHRRATPGRTMPSRASPGTAKPYPAEPFRASPGTAKPNRAKPRLAPPITAWARHKNLHTPSNPRLATPYSASPCLPLPSRAEPSLPSPILAIPRSHWQESNPLLGDTNPALYLLSYSGEYSFQTNQLLKTTPCRAIPFLASHLPASEIFMPRQKPCLTKPRPASHCHSVHSTAAPSHGPPRKSLLPVKIPALPNQPAQRLSRPFHPEPHTAFPRSHWLESNQHPALYLLSYNGKYSRHHTLPDPT